jgi:hypothetical protein
MAADNSKPMVALELTCRHNARSAEGLSQEAKWRR